MKIERKFTIRGEDPFETVAWTTRSSKIANPDGSVVFEMADAQVPEDWSQLATDIMVSKYFRKAGVPQFEDPYAIPGTPGAVVKCDASGTPITGPERSVRQVVHRLAGCWRHWGQTHNYFDTAEDAQAFYDELVYMMLHQMCAPNSPQWFNTGLHWAYGITGPAQGHFVPDPQTGTISQAPDAYTHPQPHACFIQSVKDDLVGDGGIMNLWVREARLFKYGSGTGSNFSNLRADGELLSGGGKSSGLMSWLKIGDRAAGAIKSGGTTRRAAKMVCLDMDHPDIEDFINWKVREEIKVAALVEGFKLLKEQDETIAQTAQRMGLQLDYDFNGEAYATVSGQNSNNSVRIPDRFFEAVDADGDWMTTWRTTGEVARTYKARKLWNDLGYAAWRCADPGVQFDSTINAWHTCPNGGRINASNPCSEYMFLDDTACNLASLNVIKFFDAQTLSFDVECFEHGVDLWTMVLEISVLMAAYPSERIAELSWRYRTLGLGYANLGAMVMQAGIPYDSDEARAVCACISAILTGRAYRQSALLASEHGPFAGYEGNRDAMGRVIRNHRRAAHGVDRESGDWEELKVRPVPIDHALCASGQVNIANMDELAGHAREAWDDALELGNVYGYRNAQVTVIAPTGTIGLLMDCDTTGVEPDFALVKFKKLAGGGYFKIVNESVRPALRSLGYSESQIEDMLTYILGTLHLEVPMPRSVDGVQPGETFAQWLRGKGFGEDDLAQITASLRSVFELDMAFGAWSLSDALLRKLGIEPEHARSSSSFRLLRTLGLTLTQINKLNEMICGTQSIEGSPHIKDEHLAVFDCASVCGKKGTRLIAASGHIRMMAAAQPFISGAISKTINLPNSATVEDITSSYRLSWELGLKANALYRDGCKLSQPLSNKSDVDLDEDVDLVGESEACDEVADAVACVAAEIAQTEQSTTESSADQQEVRVERITEQVVQIVHKPMRKRLPDTRTSLTHKFNVAGHEGYLTVGLYEDGKPGELFITMAKEGSTIGGLMDSLGTATSVALQYGVPVESLVNKFTHQRFEPAGMTTNRDIPIAKSLVDYIFRWMGMEFVAGYREANAPKRPNASTTTDTTPSRVDQQQVSLSHNETTRISRLEPTGGAASTGVERMSSDSASRSMATTSSTVVAEQLEKGTQLFQKTQSSTLSVALDSVGDAPPCDACGTITVRSGTCYKCLNCGNSLGCS